MMDKNSKILPCPSCGGNGKLKVKNRTIINGEKVRNCYIYCPTCDFRGPRFLYKDFDSSFSAHEAAINAWNKRCDNE